MKWHRMIPACLLLAAIAAGCGTHPAPTAIRTSASDAPVLTAAVAATAQVYDPVIRPEDFVDSVDNPFFPLVPGTMLRYRQVTEDGTETDDVTVTKRREIILGVRTTVVHDQAYLDGVLAEDTFDFHAQHRDGSVWYFGEDTKTLDPQGHVISTLGSWEAGVDGAKPGIIMLAHPA